MKKTALFITLVIELAICVAICISVNTDKYTSWKVNTASVNLVTSSSRKSSVNGSPDYKTVSVSYLDNNAVLDFKNYYPKIKKAIQLTLNIILMIVTMLFIYHMKNTALL